MEQQWKYSLIAEDIVKNVNRNLFEWLQKEKKLGRKPDTVDINSIVKTWVIRCYKDNCGITVPYSLSRAGVQCEVTDGNLTSLKILHRYCGADTTIDGINTHLKSLNYNKLRHTIVTDINFSSIINIKF